MDGVYIFIAVPAVPHCQIPIGEGIDLERKIHAYAIGSWTEKCEMGSGRRDSGLGTRETGGGKREAGLGTREAGSGR